MEPGAEIPLKISISPSSFRAVTTFRKALKYVKKNMFEIQIALTIEAGMSGGFNVNLLKMDLVEEPPTARDSQQALTFCKMILDGLSEEVFSLDPESA